MKEIIRKSKFKIKKLPHRIVIDKKERDFSKLFDMVSYKILIEKLEKYGIKHQYIDWLKNYLNFWKQYVRLLGQFQTFFFLRKDFTTTKKHQKALKSTKSTISILGHFGFFSG